MTLVFFKLTWKQVGSSQPSEYEIINFVSDFVLVISSNLYSLLVITDVKFFFPLIYIIKMLKKDKTNIFSVIVF